MRRRRVVHKCLPDNQAKENTRAKEKAKPQRRPHIDRVLKLDLKRAALDLPGPFRVQDRQSVAPVADRGLKQFGNLYRVERGAFDQLIPRAPKGETVLQRAIEP